MTQQELNTESWKTRHESQIRDFKYSLHLIKRSPLSMLGLAIIVVIIFISVCAPVLAPYDPLQVNFDQAFQPPSWKHIFGTDDLGFDVYSRVLYAGLYDLSIGVIVFAVASIIGSMVGVIAGYVGGKTDELLMRIADIFLSMPGLILAMAASAAFGTRSLQVLVIAIALNRWPSYSRLVRGQTLSIREAQFVEAARSVGAKGKRIVFQHILPNVISPIIVNGTLDIGGIILTAATLSFIGLGAPPGTPEWGRMVTEGRLYMQAAPWIMIFPGLTIFFAVLGYNLLGDGLRDILDPRVRARMGA